MAAREDLELEPVRLVYYNLQTNEVVAATRDEKALNQVRGAIQEVAADIRAREFPLKPGFICKTCEYRFLCPSQESRCGQSLEPEGDSQRAERAGDAAGNERPLNSRNANDDKAEAGCVWCASA